MTTKKAPTYTELKQQLDEVMVKLQTEDIDIDVAIAEYERATQLIEQLEKHLAGAKLKITKLTTESRS